MEAAILLPVLMLVLALLLQPALVLYTRSHMAAAAAEAAHVASISATGASSDCVSFCKRRLQAIPPLEIFHVGGPDAWDISVEGTGTRKASVHIQGSLRPLPLLGIIASVFGKVEGPYVVLEVGATANTKPDWLSGSYESWISMWA